MVCFLFRDLLGLCTKTAETLPYAVKYGTIRNVIHTSLWFRTGGSGTIAWHQCFLTKKPFIRRQRSYRGIDHSILDKSSGGAWDSWLAHFEPRMSFGARYALRCDPLRVDRSSMIKRVTFSIDIRDHRGRESTTQRSYLLIGAET
jgi:hypothetical protein